MSQNSDFDSRELWLEDGHVSELVVSFVADGESTHLPADVLQHVDSCPACLDRVAEFAHISLSMGAALEELDAEQLIASQLGAARLAAEEPHLEGPSAETLPPDSTPSEPSAVTPPPTEKASAAFPWLGLAAAVLIGIVGTLSPLSQLPFGAMRFLHILREGPGFVWAVLSSVPEAVEQAVGSIHLLSLTATVLLIVTASAIARHTHHSPIEGQAS